MRASFLLLFYLLLPSSLKKGEDPHFPLRYYAMASLLDSCSQAKIFGVAISVGGALTMVIWKGPAITESTLLSSSQASTGRTTFGSILVIVAVLSTCFWNILVGIMVIGLSFYAMIWCIHKRGPVFTSAFNPLFIIFSFLLETFVYKNPAHWGSIVGAVLIVSGLYLLLWAKARDAETEEVKEDEPISSPLIQS
ncbi:WAT1-related protein At1g43650-like isoform X2 [Macadamia integrifolia]|uniref:WAT1-related protein At1g43650-like isoform X2 n=1 Tax=Macadamia integrifolia TaxID=60698 RepID=UPI001C530E34|nr:WAT1-related protein At1g43650-like isoform X2 [Macadamia integrifolia]